MPEAVMTDYETGMVIVTTERTDNGVWYKFELDPPDLEYFRMTPELFRESPLIYRSFDAPGGIVYWQFGAVKFEIVDYDLVGRFFICRLIR